MHKVLNHRLSLWLNYHLLILQCKTGKDSGMSDGSVSMMSMSGLSLISDIDSTYDTIAAHKVTGKNTSVDYCRQKKKYVAIA